MTNISDNYTQRELENYYRKKYKCPYCEERFIWKATLINHERIHTKFNKKPRYGGGDMKI